MAPIRIIFMGTAPLAAVSLRALLGAPFADVAAVVTQPDRPKGRDLKLQPSAVKEVAMERGLPVLQPEKARDPQFLEHIRQLAPELIVVAAFGQILPQTLLDIPRHGCLNVHASLLPRWRGAAPIQWAILEGDAETGVTIMKIDAGLDTGDMLSTAATPISPADNAQTLHDRLAQMGAELLVRTIPDYVAGRIPPRPQPTAGVTYAHKLTKEHGRLDWGLPAGQLWRRVRAFTPWPGAFTYYGEPPKLIKIWEAEVADTTGPTPGEILAANKTGIVVACGQQSLRLKSLQQEGGRKVTAQEFLAGHPLSPGSRFNLGREQDSKELRNPNSEK